LRDRISIRGVAAATCVVVASTGLTVAVHAVASEPDPQTAASAAPAVTRIADLPAQASVSRAAVPRDERAQRASRSSARVVSSSNGRVTSKAIAASIAERRYGWGPEQFSCLDSLWERESGWDVHASNASGAYGIPQSLPGSKMSAFGGDWRDSATTQIRWGLDYIDGRYGSTCGAWRAFGSKGWY